MSCLQNGILMFPPPIPESNLTYIWPPCIRWPNWIMFTEKIWIVPHHHIHITMITSLLLLLLLLLLLWPADVHTAYCPAPGSNVGNVDGDTPALTILQWSPVAGEETLSTGLTTNLQRLYTVYGKCTMFNVQWLAGWMIDYLKLHEANIETLERYGHYFQSIPLT